MVWLKVLDCHPSNLGLSPDYDITHMSHCGVEKGLWPELLCIPEKSFIARRAFVMRQCTT